MFGKFQKSHLRIEVEAPASVIRDSLLHTSKLKEWLLPQSFSPGIPEKLHSGLTFTTSIGIVSVEHKVEIANDNCLRLILSKAIDGYHEWYWGEGWVQSRLEGISMLPLSLGQTMSLLRFRQFVSTQPKVNS